MSLIPTSPSSSQSKSQNSKTLILPHKPSPQTLQHLLSQLNRCSSIDHLRRFHAKIIKTQFSRDPFLLTRLAHAYLRSRSLAPAERILTKAVKNPPVFLWNETIKGFARNGYFRESMDLYYTMTGGRGGGGVRPNEFTFTFVLPACAGARSVLDGRKVHDDVVRWNCESNVFVATALVDMYGKCGEIEAARQVFDKMPSKGTATYNAMIAG
eukprot:TRINITY_DN17657_c1_g1_i4.p1 TRINITY_DN17657_c1_g1~~TRINITY_DN17657_c1_g1_i4.p1  ORF type:complete len:211 (+),score=22.55 TRINITY_DN17657_c1_g1_i4:81-713(+)